VIVGGGPTGVELAGAIAELARHGLRGQFRVIDPVTARIVLVQSAPRLLPGFRPPFQRPHSARSRNLGLKF
jgi:NADH dehydrogenase FAD-containing subunit